MAQAQRAHILNTIVIVVENDHRIDLRRAPDVHDACHEVLGEQTERYALPLRQLLAYVSAHEWRKKGVLIAALNSNIHPHYGVFTHPWRVFGAHQIRLTAQSMRQRVGHRHRYGRVISAVLAKRGLKTILATDTDPRALACAQENFGAARYH